MIRGLLSSFHVNERRLVKRISVSAWLVGRVPLGPQAGSTRTAVDAEP